jgi:type I restriction enzyme, S subunit
VVFRSVWFSVHPELVEGRILSVHASTGSARTGETETCAQLLDRILAERRRRWEEKQLAKFKEQGKIPPQDWQDKYPEPVKPDITNLPELPDSWVWASVDQCALDETAITDGPFGSNLKSEHYQVNGPQVIRLQNIGEGVFVDSRAHISQEHYAHLTKHSVSTGDLVVAMLGEILPRACVVPDGIEPAIVKADCARIRVNRDLLLPTVLNACLNSPSTRERVVGLVKGIGRPRINLRHIRAIPVPLCSQAEQQAIESALVEANESIDNQLAAIELTLKRVSAQRKNILKAAFSGQLVPQDPDDEPAGMLLERIRAERATRAENGTRGRKSGTT